MPQTNLSASERQQFNQKVTTNKTTTITTTTTETKSELENYPNDNNNTNTNTNSNEETSIRQTVPVTKRPPTAGPNLKSSIYDWDSPSSFTGTVKRRPYPLTSPNSQSPSPPIPPSAAAARATLISSDDNQPTDRLTEQVNNNERQKSRQRRQSRQAKRPGITPLGGNVAEHTVAENKMQRSHRNNKEKPSKLRLSKTSDRNANSTTNSPTMAEDQTMVGGTIRKTGGKPSTSTRTTSKRDVLRNNENFLGIERAEDGDTGVARDANYMELDFQDPMFPGNTDTPPQFTELFCDFPVSYESTAVITAIQFAKTGLVSKPPPQPPPYREPPPPTPPPISQMPSRESRLIAQQQLSQASVSLSAPSTPSRGKVVLSKKERKELSKLHKLQDTTSGSASNLGAGFDLGEATSSSAQSSPYKGRVNELRNCIAKINSRGLFASLNRSSQKSLNAANTTLNDDPTSSNDASPPPPAPPDTSPPSSTASNNNDADYSEKLKNLPVRQRRALISHMDNYCLFDPVDFINEKALKYRKQGIVDMSVSAEAHGLRDPLFSSSQNLDFTEEEMVPEVIYDEQEPEETAGLELACAMDVNNYSHHNYFVIDPEDFEPEPRLDIGIPNPHTNEQLVNVNLGDAGPSAAKEEPVLHVSESFDILLDAFEAAPSMSNSQESKDTNTTSNTTTTSTALVESSTSTNSTSSSTSAPSSQTTLQRTKKKLTFLNLSPFRSQASDRKSSGNIADGDKCKSSQTSENNKTTERAISALVSSDHMLHLQHMLSDNKDNLRSRTVPIESNYVLFNPGPVPSRNVQYKIRKSRPLSTHSDADSGFLSPCSPDELSSLKFNPAILVLQQCDSVQGYIEIYTDWANYYLERAKSKKKVTDLSADCRDGLLLADVIEAVTSFKVPDLVKKPKSQQQMYDNVNSCLNVLRTQAVGGLDNITTNDICAGRLKAVLALFFALSRYKQQSKQTKSSGAGGGGNVGGIGVSATKAELHQQPVCVADKNQQQANTTTPNANVVVSTTQGTTSAEIPSQQQQQHAQSVQNGNDTMVNRQIPTAYSKANGGTSIPLPATVMVQRRCPPDKVRPLPPTPNHTPSIPGLGKSGADFNLSRPNSPPTSNHTIQSLKSGNNNGLRPPTVQKTHQSGIPPPTTSLPSATPSSGGSQQKHSMLDKLKLFNKEKQQQQNAVTAAANKTQLQSKRTSSSSGFSSARSERSDSSLSLNDGHISQIKPPAVSVTASKGKPNTKQSKLLAAQLKKEQVKAGKLEKKEKSPARSLNREETSATCSAGMETRSSTMGKTKNSLPRVSEKNSTKTSSKSSLNSKSESKSSLIMPASKTLGSPVSGGTGLPKPIAAIKGTSKLPQAPIADNKTRMSNSNSQHDMLKREKSDISTAQPNHISDRKDHDTRRGQQQSATHIVKPVPILLEPGSKPPYYANTSSISESSQNFMAEPHSSPQRLGTATPEQPTYVNNSRLPPLKSGISTPTSRKLEYNSGPNILSPQRSPLRAMTHSPHAQLDLAMGTPQSSPGKFHTIPSKIVGTIYEEEKPESILPMRPLLRGYNSHVTLPTRGARGTHHYVSDFCESDIGQGYCSDGDALRVSSSRLSHGSSAASSRFHDIDNGYLSEGSGGVGLNGGNASGGGAHGKHFLSMMRARTQLPTTIEERIRNSRGSLDSIGTAPPSSAASQASSSGGSNTKMDISNGGGSGCPSANASPQHHHGGHGHSSHRSSSRNSRDNWSKMPEPLNGHKPEKSDKSSPSHSRRSVSGGSSSKQGSPSGRTKGVPPSFGYVKRANGSATATAEQQNIMMMGGPGGCLQNGPQQSGRTAHVSAVPRTATGGRKMSGGTQTLPNDMTKMPPSTQHRSFSLTGPGATQLSQSIRERLATGSHSLPKPGSDMHMFQHRISNRPGKLIDGSLSDTQTYAEVKPEYSTYAMWLKHSNTAGSRLSEGDSIENMQIGSPAMTRHGHKMLQHRNAAAAVAAAAASGGSGAGGNGGAAVAAGTESPYVQSPRLNRSNSIRSTKSEKMYPSMLSRGPDVEIEPYYCLPVGTLAGQNGVISAQMAAAAAAAASHVSGQAGSVGGNGPVAWSQPTSPTPINRGFGGPLSPTHGGALGLTGMSSAAAAAAATGGHRLTYPKKNDEVHGSAASLLSGGSSLYGSAEERQANEIRRLKRELLDAREQVLSLSSQLSTNATKLKLQKKIDKLKSKKGKCNSNNRDSNIHYHSYYGAAATDGDNADRDGDSEVKNLLDSATTRKKCVIINGGGTMSASATTRPSPTTPIYDGYATIRSRGLYRSRSIRATELEDADADAAIAATTPAAMQRPPVERKRTLSLKSNISQSSVGSSPHHSHRSGSEEVNAEEIYASRHHAKPVKTPTITDLEPLYASANNRCNTTFRPLSDASSSSGGGGSAAGCRDSVVGSSGSGSLGGGDYQNVKKNSRFSLDSLHSSVTPKTPDYTTAEEENIFLYTAPDSPKRRLDSGIRSSYNDSDHGYSPVPKSAFEMQEYPVLSTRTPSEHSMSSCSPSKNRRVPIRSSSNASSHYQRAKSLVESGRPMTLMTSSFHRSESESPTYASVPRTPISPTAPVPPQAPVRRESLYAKPKIYSSPTHGHPQLGSYLDTSSHSPMESPPPRITYYQLPLPILSPPQRSSSAEILERSHTSHSLATIDQDEILVVPTAMPVLENSVDRRYHTLGHMRVQSLGTSLHRTYDSPMGSMLNMMTGTFYAHTGLPHYHTNLQPHKSAGNIYASAEAAVADLNRLAPEYVDPLDFKIGCQTTLRSKPIIPWYELAIKRDFKRQSCPPISGTGLTSGSTTLSPARSSANQAHVVAAFEQSLSNMTSRLHHLTATAERKDGELTDMRQTIELLRKQSIQAGLTTAHMQSMGVQTQGQSQNDMLSNKPPPLPPSMPGRTVQQQQQQHPQPGTNGGVGVMQRHHSSDSMCSLNSISSGCSAQDKKKKKGWLRSSFTKAFSRNAKISKTSRHGGQGPHSGAAHPHAHNHLHGESAGSLTAAHTAGVYNKSNGHGHIGEPPGLGALATQPAPPLPSSPTKGSPAKTVTLIDNAKPIDAIDHEDHQVVEELKKQLREKDLVLTDIRLEALSSASQLESLKETVNKMRAEMMSLKQNNERLQKMVTTRSLAGSEASLGNAISPSGSMSESRRYSLADANGRPPMELPKRLEEEVEEENIPPAPAPEPPPPPLSPTTHIDLTPPPPALDSIPSPAHIPVAVEELSDVTDGKKIGIACYLGQPESFAKYCEEMLEIDDFYANSAMVSNTDQEGNERKVFPTASLNEFVIAYTYISGKTTWQNLDYIVRKTFKDYVSRIDPGTNLGLNTDSITSYHLGEAKRGPEMGFPELLPCGYIIGNVRTLYICLQGVGSLAFDSLIPRSIVHRYISLLTEHRRLILCGPSGTGKSYLARRLAEFLVARSGRGNPSEAIATFNVDHKSSKELRQYLGHIAEQAVIANGASELPSVIILDNLHHASALGDVFSCLLSAGPAAKLPCIIGTMSQATCNTTNLQLHHNFRWVLTANHMEPVKGFLGRFLRRRLFQLELQTQHPQQELATVLAWLPTVWQHINRFLEIHSSSDVTIGPRLFLSCPLDLKDSQVWFTDIWNYHLSPYLVEAVREGVQLYGRRGGAWNDPSAFIRNSYPWPYGPDSVPQLRQINAEDVGLEGVAASNGENQDPLLNMLMRLQEAANYSENQDQESDCASLDSNVTPDSSAGAE